MNLIDTKQPRLKIIKQQDPIFSIYVSQIRTLVSKNRETDLPSKIERETLLTNETSYEANKMV